MTRCTTFCVGNAQLSGQVTVGSAGGAWAARRVWARLAWVYSRRHIEPGVRFSRTRLADILDRRHSAPASPRPVGSWRDDGSVEVNQSIAVRPGVEKLPAIPPGALMAVCDQQREAAIRIVDDLVELDRRVAVAEIARAATQEPVEVCTTCPTGQRRRSRAVSSRTRSRARCIACREGQRARKLAWRERGVCPRTQRR